MGSVFHVQVNVKIAFLLNFASNVRKAISMYYTTGGILEFVRLACFLVLSARDKLVNVKSVVRGIIWMGESVLEIDRFCLISPFKHK